MNKRLIKQCEICYKEILCKQKIRLSGKNGYMLDTNNGVCFKRKWFCNECWDKIIEYDKINRKTKKNYLKNL